MTAGWLGNKQAFPSPEQRDPTNNEVVYTMEEGVSLFQYTCIQVMKGMLPSMAGRFEDAGLADMAVRQAAHLIRAMEDAQVKIHEGRIDELLED